MNDIREIVNTFLIVESDIEIELKLKLKLIKTMKL